jgi:hypothetical protein
MAPRMNHFFLPFFSSAIPFASFRATWAWVDLNHRPHPYQGCALTA